MSFLIFMIIICIIVLLFQTTVVKNWLDYCKLHIPILKPIFTTIYTARFARGLSSLYSSGLSMIQFLQICKGLIGNSYVEKQFYDMILDVKNGVTLSKTMNKNASLYVKGQMVYGNEFNIKERGNLGLITEMNRVLSSFVQFHKAQKNDTEIGNIYMCGMNEMEESLCSNISTALGIPTKVLQAPDRVIANDREQQLSSHFFEIGNLLREQS